MDSIKRPEIPKKEDLIKLYDVCNIIFKNKECFYENEKEAAIEKREI